MALRYTHTQTAFGSGELGTFMQAHSDTDQHARGCKKLRNMIVGNEVFTFRRMGTTYAGEVKDSTKETRLIDFTFSENDSYAIEIGNQYMRFWQDGAQLAGPYEIVSPYLTAELEDISYDQQGDVMYLTAGGTSHRPQKLTRTSATTFSIENFPNARGPVLGVFNQATTLTASATTGTITLTASGATFEAGHVGGIWELRDTSNTVGTRGYFRITAVASATSATAEVAQTLPTTSATSYYGKASWDGVQGYPRALALHQNRLAFAGTVNEPLGLYFSVSNGNFEDFDYAETLATSAFNFNLTGRLSNALWLESDSRFLTVGTTGGVSAIGAANGSEALSVSNIEAIRGDTYGSAPIQAVLLAGSIKYFQRNGKRLYQAIYDDISLKHKAADLSVLNSEILSSGVKQSFTQSSPINILWIVTNDGKLIGFTEENQNSVKAFHVHEFGTDKVESGCVVSENNREVVYLIVNRTINGSTKRYVEYFYVDQENTDNFLDCSITYDGTKNTTLALSSLSGSGVTATAGAATFSASDVGQKIQTADGKSLAVITGFTSGTVVTVDILADFASEPIAANGWCLSKSSFTNLTHLAGRKVMVFGDGAFSGEHSVSVAGAIDVGLDNAFFKGRIGLSYKSTIAPTNHEPVLQNGSSRMGQKKISMVGLSLYKTAPGFLYGPTDTNQKRFYSYTPSHTMNNAPALLGDGAGEVVKFSFNGDWSDTPDVYISQDLPAPLSVLSITRQYEFSSGVAS